MKNIDVNEIERLRTENEERLKYLETQYFAKRDPEKVGNIILERLGKGPADTLNRNTEEDEVDLERDDPLRKSRSGRRKKSVKIVAGDEKENRVQFGNHNDDDRMPRSREQGVRASGPKTISRSKSAKQRGRSNSKNRASPEVSPRQSLYEAKFEKYLANKELKEKQEKKLSKLKKEDFEIYMRGPESPSKSAQRFSALKKSGGNYEADSLLP